MNLITAQRAAYDNRISAIRHCYFPVWISTHVIHQPWIEHVTFIFITLSVQRGPIESMFWIVCVDSCAVQSRPRQEYFVSPPRLDPMMHTYCICDYHSNNLIFIIISLCSLLVHVICSNPYICFFLNVFANNVHCILYASGIVNNHTYIHNWYFSAFSPK